MEAASRRAQLPTQWQDLSLNVPGQAARSRAHAERAAQKDRGKVRAFMQHLLDVKTDERNWRVGADGEETIGAKLEKLTKHGWYVLHAVPIGDRGSDIDHVLIGPGGVFTLDTKTHPGGSVWVGRYAIKVNGQSTQYLRNSRFEAQRAARLLSTAIGHPVEVTPVLVFLTGTLIPNVTIKQTPDDVRILDRMDVPSAFKRASRRLTCEQVELGFQQARRSTTWTES
ncbi:MAG: nuclease-related domain-containing protein [Candidatus Nanopelagicales bacterium]